MHICYSLVYCCRTSFCIGSEVGVRQHSHNRFLVEESYCIGRESCDVYQGICVRMTVYQSICNEISSFFGIKYVHCSEMVVSFLDSDNFLSYLDSVAVLGIKSCNESICITGFNHHHTEVVAFEHLIVGFLEVCSLTGTFFAQDACIAFAAFCFVIVSQVYYFYTFKAQFKFFCKFLYSFCISQKDRVAYTFSLCFYCSFKHVRVCAFCKYYSLWAAACCFVQLACQFVFLSHQFAKVVLVFVPVGYFLAGNSRFHSCLGYCHRYFCNKTWIYRFWYEIFRTE